MVTVLIGVNDQYRRRSAGQYLEGLGPVIDRALSFAGGDGRRVIVLSIPDWGVTPFAAGDQRTPDEIGSEIDEFNEVNGAEARRIGARYVDVTAVSRAARKDGSLLVSDGLHPSGKMYALWVKDLLPVARAVLAG